MELYDQTGIGLRCRCHPSGRATFSVVMHGRRHMLGDALGATIPQAREAAHRLRWQIAQGHDPRAAREAARAAAAPPPKPGPRMVDVIGLYEAARRKSPDARTRSWPSMERRIRTVFSGIMTKPAAQVTVGDLQAIIDAHPSPRSIAPVLATLKGCLRWASAPGRDRVDEHLLRVSLDVATTERERVLDPDELARLLPVLEASEAPHAAVLRMLLWTGCRLREVTDARWSDVDMAKGTLTVPKERAKNGRAHVITLPRQAVALLADRRPLEADPAALVFPRTGNGRLPLASWSAATAKLQAASGTSGWHRHDLRRTAATILGRDLKVAPFVIDAVLNHAPAKITRTYNASTYEADRAAALQLLADGYDAISGANVVPLRAA